MRRGHAWSPRVLAALGEVRRNIVTLGVGRIVLHELRSIRIGVRRRGELAVKWGGAGLSGRGGFYFGLWGGGLSGDGCRFGGIAGNYGCSYVTAAFFHGLRVGQQI